MPRYCCPQCGRSDGLDVVVTCWARLNQNDSNNLETDIDTSDQEWNEDSVMRCASCGRGGKVRDFTGKENE